MQLLTPEQREAMLTNGQRYQTDPYFEPLPVVKLFTPWAACTWLLTDLDPDDHDIASGLCDLGFGEPEIGMDGLSAYLGSVTQSRTLNFCPECVAADVAGGMAAWRRVHQLPGVFICPEHLVTLRTTDISAFNQAQLLSCPADPEAEGPSSSSCTTARPPVWRGTASGCSSMVARRSTRPRCGLGSAP